MTETLFRQIDEHLQAELPALRSPIEVAADELNRYDDPAAFYQRTRDLLGQYATGTLLDNLIERASTAGPSATNEPLKIAPLRQEFLHGSLWAAHLYLQPYPQIDPTFLQKYRLDVSDRDMPIEPSQSDFDQDSPEYQLAARQLAEMYSASGNDRSYDEFIAGFSAGSDWVHRPSSANSDPTSS